MSATSTAHRIKGAAASVSAVALREVAGQIEEKGKNGDLRAMAERLPQLERQMHLATEAMHTSL
jgi:HPt (histidine-containing phosphotransfer) domain-containing protein